MLDSIQTIRRSAGHFLSGTALSRISGMFRDITMAYAFGTQPAVAAFMLAFRLSHLLRRLFGEGALQAAFVPEFEAIRQENPHKALQFFCDLYLFLIGLLSLITLIGAGSLYILARSIESEFHEIFILTLYMLPSLIFICLYGFNTALLQCEKKYFLPSIAPVAFNMVWIITTLWLKWMNLTKAQDMRKLAVGVVFACFLQWLITFFPLKRLLPPLTWNNWSAAYLAAKRIIKPLILGILGVAAFQINNAIDALFARYAEPEGPAFLWYAIRLQQFPLALFGIAIAGAVLPPLSRAIKSADWIAYQRFLSYALKSTFNWMLPATCFLFLMGETCVRLIFGRGQFNLDSIWGTTSCLWGYAFGLLPSALVLILAPALYAQGNYRLPTYAAFLTIILNICFNTLFIHFYHLGAKSVAWATSFSAWINLFFLGSMLYQHHSIRFLQDFKYNAIYVTLTCLMASYLTLQVQQLNFTNDGFFEQSQKFILQIITFGLPFLILKNKLYSLLEN